MSSFHRGGVRWAAYGCLNAYNKRKPGVEFFLFPKQQMRYVEKLSACWLGPSKL